MDTPSGFVAANWTAQRRNRRIGVPTDNRGKTVAIEAQYDLYAIRWDSETLADTTLYMLTLAPRPRRLEKLIYLESHYGRSICCEVTSDHLSIVGLAARQLVGQGL